MGYGNFHSIIKLAISAGMLLLLAGCANDYARFYTDETGGVFSTNLEMLGGEPKIFSGTPGPTGRDDDSIKMLEDGYFMVGHSSFLGEAASQKGLIAQAKKVNASVAIMYSEYSGSETRQMQINTPTTSTTTTNANGSVYGSNGGYANYSGTATSTTRGTETTNIPYTINRYRQAASYWAKVKKFRSGLHTKNLDADTRARIQSNKGVEVIIVVKNTPGFSADIFKGDIIKQMGNTEITDDKAYQAALDKYEGKETDITIYRNGNLITKKIHLGTPN